MGWSRKGSSLSVLSVREEPYEMARGGQSFKCEQGCQSSTEWWKSVFLHQNIDY